MGQNRINVLDYDHDRIVDRGVVKRAYNKWRAANDIPMRCDDPQCPFHTGELDWKGSKLPLELDHEDGNPHNNRVSNLRYLCGNCASQLPTKGGGNVGRIQELASDSYSVVERDGSRTVKVMLTGFQLTTSIRAIATTISV